MTSSEFLELAIIAFIVIGIGAAIWRGGASNPVGTGGLNARLTNIEGRVEQIEEHAATTEDIKRLEAGLAQHAADMSKLAAMMANLPERIEANKVAIEKVAHALPDIESRQRAMHDTVTNVRTDVAAIATSAKHTAVSVDRLYDILIEKGVSK